MAFMILPSEDDEGRDFTPEPPMAKEKKLHLEKTGSHPFYTFW